MTSSPTQATGDKAELAKGSKGIGTTLAAPLDARPDDALPLPPEDEPARTAIFVAHGMGQQVPFETIDLVVQGLAESPLRDWEVDADRSLGRLRVGEDELRRVGLTLRRGGETRRVDVYEAYWAPLTEGKTGLADVMGFFVDGGKNGVRNGLGAFRRWLFGGPHEFPPVRGAVLALVLGLTTIASLTVMNLLAAAFVTALLAGKAIGITAALQRELTFGLLAFLSVAGVLLAWMVLGLLARTRDRRRMGVLPRFSFTRRHALRDAGMAAFACTLGAATGVLLAGLAVAGAYALGDAPDLTTRGRAVLAVLVAVPVAFLLVVRTGGTALALGVGVLAAAVAWMGQLTIALVLGAVAAALLLVTAARFAAFFVEQRRTRSHPRRDGSVAFSAYATFSTLAVLAVVALAPGIPGGTSLLAAAVPGSDPQGSGFLVDALVALAAATLLATALPLAQGTSRSALDLLLAVVGTLLVLTLVVALVPGAWGHPDLVSILAAWGIVAAVSWKVRGLLVQYLGDVAAYVSPHKLDRFSELREAIKARVKTAADAVYAHRLPNGEFQYERVLVVAHSLGSVVAYDTLNALLRDDEHALARQGPPPAEPKPWETYRRVAERTRVLVTFGSPLARTAFVFSTQQDPGRHAREALAASVQPLISRPSARKHMRWVNVHATADIISSRLTYYDTPESLDPDIRRVEDVEDDDATTPLAAHVEYWQSATVWRPVVMAAFAP